MFVEKDGNWDEASNTVTHPKKLLAEDRNWEEASNKMTHPKKSLAEKDGNWEEELSRP